jgi:hypothetical protein
MRTIFTRNQNAVLKRAVKASLVLLVLVGGGYAWQKTASERIAERAEQARVAALQMTPRKLDALKREAAIEAAAQAYAEKYQAAKQLRARRSAEENAPAQAQRRTVQHKG